jgi:hypothetical protein
MIRKISVVMFLSLVALVSRANATPVCPDGGLLSTFLAQGYTCQIGDKLFSDFSYVSSAFGGALAVPSAGVTVDTLGPAGTGASILSTAIGLEFSAGWNALAGQTTDSDIDFTVTVLGGGSLDIEDFGLAQVSGVLPNGSASVVENGCGPAPCTPAELEVMTFDYGGSNTQRVSDTMFAPVGSVTVSKDVSVTGGTTGSAHLSLVSDTFSQTSIVPEPSTLVLLASGLFGLAYLPRRRRSSRS